MSMVTFDVENEVIYRDDKKENDQTKGKRNTTRHKMFFPTFRPIWIQKIIPTM